MSALPSEESLHALAHSYRLDAEQSAADMVAKALDIEEATDPILDSWVAEVRAKFERGELEQSRLV